MTFIPARQVYHIKHLTLVLLQKQQLTQKLQLQKNLKANASSAAQIAKQEAMVTKGFSRTFAKVKQIRNSKTAVWSKYDVLNISKYLETRTIAIDEFLIQVLPYYLK